MDILNVVTRAVDWVVARTGQEEGVCSSNSARMTCDMPIVVTSQPDCRWEDLPGDVFEYILKHVTDRYSSHPVCAIRLTCKNWKQHTDTRLMALKVMLKSTTPDKFRISQAFSNIKDLRISCAFDVKDQNQLFEDIKHLKNIRNLEFKQCKGKILSGLENLASLKQLKRLLVDWDIFSHIVEDGILISSINILVINDCKALSPKHIQYLSDLNLLTRLVLIHADSFAEYLNTHYLRYNFEDLCMLPGIKDLAIISYDNLSSPSARIPSAISYSNSRRPLLESSLKNLIIQKNNIAPREFEAICKLTSLKSLSIFGMAELPEASFRKIENLEFLSHLSIGGHGEGGGRIEVALDVLGKMKNLNKIEFYQCLGVEEEFLHSAFQRTVECRVIHNPEEALHHVSLSLDYEKIESFLWSIHMPEVPEAPIYGNFFSPSLLINLADKSRIDLIQLLVDHGADIDYGNPFFPRNCDCSTPLHFAVHRRNKKAVVDLLNLGARVNAHCTEDRRTPLHLSASGGDVDMVRTLLKAGASVNNPDGDNRTPLHVAISWGAKEIIQELMKEGADGSIPDFDLITPIAYAARQGDVNLIKFLLDAGFNINEGINCKYPSPLHVAVRAGKMQVVAFLLENGANVYAVEHNGQTVFGEACHSNRRHILRYLLNAAKPDKEFLETWDDAGFTLLHYVAMNGWLDIAECLIASGVDVNRTDPKGFTALYYADCQGHKDVVCRLTKEGGLARWLTRPKLYRCPWVMRGRQNSINS